MRSSRSGSRVHDRHCVRSGQEAAQHSPKQVTPEVLARDLTDRSLVARVHLGSFSPANVAKRASGKTTAMGKSP